ncbi:hypothetical protein BH11MYX2_BH11MYX2_07390 [soil metagenome]
MNTGPGHVRLDVYSHSDDTGRFGIQTEKGAAIDLLATWTDELEARHGYLPWLHAEEHYGTRTPNEERVTEHPIGKESRPRLALSLVDAIAGRIDSNRRTIRDRALIAQIPHGRLVGTLETVAKHSTIEPDVAVLVTMSVQQTPRASTCSIRPCSGTSSSPPARRSRCWSPRSSRPSNDPGGFSCVSRPGDCRTLHQSETRR